MSQYRIGSVDVTKASAVVVGHATVWLQQLHVGDLFSIKGEGVWYEILSVDTDLQITLKTNYVADSKSAQPYVVQRDFTPNNKFPTPTYGDIDGASLIQQTLLKIDAQLAALSPVNAALQGDISLVGSVVIDCTAMGLVIGGVNVGQILMGAPNSGGTGFRLLRIAN